MKKKSILFLLLLFHLFLHAQTIKVEGRVRNEKGEPLAGATVTVKGSTLSTVTSPVSR